MSKFVLSANLPINAEYVLLGEKYRDRLDRVLRSYGLRPLYIPDNPYVDARLSGHADLSVLHIGENRLILAPYLKNSDLSDKMTELGFEISFPDIQMNKAYPQDSMLNICVCGDRFFCNTSSADKSCIEMLRQRGAEPLHVKQGYTKCAVCVVDEKSIITSDQGIHTATLKVGYDSLLITEGHIVLQGFPYGFIGGSSFKISSSKLAFTGSLDAHPSREKIIEFVKRKEIEPVFLTNDEIFDIGSILPLTEK